MRKTLSGTPLRCWSCMNDLTEKEATESPYFCERCERTTFIKVAPHHWQNITHYPTATKETAQ